jgi:hypothetical protein
MGVVSTLIDLSLFAFLEKKSGRRAGVARQSITLRTALAAG